MRSIFALIFSLLVELPSVSAIPCVEKWADVNSIETHKDTLAVPFLEQDFAVNGHGDHPSWSTVLWTDLPRIDTNFTSYTSRFKVQYSAKGIYVLFDGTDNRRSSSYRKDFSDMYNGDVFEVFFHPEPSTPVYFEYEVNAHDKELVLLIPNLNHRFVGWLPWKYTADRKTRKAVRIYKQSGRMIGWRAEVFIPFALLSPLEKIPPQKGTTWKANFCRLDYDSGKMIKWSWSPILTSFHEYEKYKTLVFQ